MRILHTSDWHLGRLFHGASLRREQREALARIVELVAEHRVELIVIAGDLYDRAIPPADAVELFDDTLVALRELGTAVVAISGNHDSSVRVGFGERLLAAAGVTIRGDVGRCAQPVVFAANDGGPPVAVYPVPYLDPLAVGHHVRRTAPDDGVETDGAPAAPARRITHDHATTWALDQVRADLAARSARSVVVAHTFVNGGAASGSERELTVGDVDLVGLGTVSGFDYVALGHLHRPQAWRDDTIAYSGSPVPYAFSEEGHAKSVRIVDLAPDGSVAVQLETLSVGRPLRTLTGQLDDLLTDRSLTPDQGAFVRAVLTDRHLPLQAMGRLQRRFPHAVELRHQPPVVPDAQLTADPPIGATDLRRADPYALSVRFLDEQRGFPAEAAERAILTHAFDDARRCEAS